MQLKKILEEIDIKIAGSMGKKREGLLEARDVIRKHMNDGWIPVEERLPDNNENVLVTTDMGLIASGYIAHGTWITDQEPDYPIAWRPLPEPYRPEPETEKPDWRQDMLRKFDRRTANDKERSSGPEA